MQTQKIIPPITWKLAAERKKLKQLNTPIVVGVLALQGDFLEHILTLQRLGVKTKEVKLPEDLEEIDGLIMPGGESTTQAHLLDVFNLRSPLIKKIKNNMPVWGTCAGMILLAKKLVQDKPIPLGVMDIVVNRNAYGRQLDSFEVDLSIKPLGKIPLHATFIRAPIIERIETSVEILSTLSNGTIVAVKQEKMLGTSFHPELTKDARFHEYFLHLIEK